MKIQIRFKYLLAMFALMLVLGELHEQVHINTGYFICGGYGERDFNVWKGAENCALPNLRFLLTAAGPIFSYLVIWTGAFLLLKATSKEFKAIGFSLIFAPLPFARIFTALMGGGDEKVVFLKLFQDDLSPATCKVLAAVFVMAVCLPPILIAWSKIKNRYAGLYILGFCVLPLIVLGFYVMTFLNGLLASGFLSSVGILGTPILILAHFCLMAAILFFCRGWILNINRLNNP